jgi:hypothetical protein
MTPPPNSVKSVAQSSLPLASDAVDSSISDSDSHKCLGGSSGGLSQDVSQLSTVKGFGLSRESVHLEKNSFDELAGTSNHKVDEDKSMKLLESSLLDSQVRVNLTQCYLQKMISMHDFRIWNLSLSTIIQS